MKLLICEDEKPTAERLVKLLNEYDNTLQIVSILHSVESTVEWISEHGQPDLIFQDIELSDGNCFGIFEKIEVVAPIIFTTAYSDYAVKSFSQNSIDYIVKPYDFADIKRAMDKFRNFKKVFQLLDKNLLEKILKSTNNKSRFLVKLGEFYKTIQTEDIGFINSEEGLSVVYLLNGEKHLLDRSLNELESDLDAKSFFRINRSTIIHFQSIQSIRQWFSGRLKLELVSDLNKIDEIYVSRSRVPEFKKWLGT